MIKYDSDVAALIEQLLQYSEQKLGISELDFPIYRNRLMKLFGISNIASKSTNEAIITQMTSPTTILEQLSLCALSKNLIVESEVESFETFVMGIVTPLESSVMAKFEEEKISHGVADACNYLYDFCQKTNYIKKERLAKNKTWSAKGKKGDLIMTINTAKPEKNNEEIARLKSLPQTDYPKCELCVENMGYSGRDGYVAKDTLRVVPLTLANDAWYMQYSPYTYYKEHCIVFSKEHSPMVINEKTYVRLFDFVEQFQHYFLGSNACIPIVGGSILAHEHYQGGCEKMPLFQAQNLSFFASDEFKSVSAFIVDWYASTIRLESSSKEDIIKCANLITAMWQEYSDATNNIVAKTNKQHNAVTPIARIANGKFIIEIILRNNKTSQAFPYGIFHTHPEFFNIKQEALGIIEMLGLFVLPGRLATELEEVKGYLTGKKRSTPKALTDETNDNFKHFEMVKAIIKKYSNDLSEEDAEIVLQEEIGIICEKILSCASVFKQDTQGKEGFVKFLNTCGFFKKQL